MNLIEEIKAFRLFLGRGTNIEILNEFIKLEEKIESVLAHLQNYIEKIPEESYRLSENIHDVLIASGRCKGGGYAKLVDSTVYDFLDNIKEELDKRMGDIEPMVCIKLTDFKKIVEDTKVEILGMFAYQGPPSRHWIDTKGQFWKGWNDACDKLSKELLGNTPKPQKEMG